MGQADGIAGVAGVGDVQRVGDGLAGVASVAGRGGRDRHVVVDHECAGTAVVVGGIAFGRIRADGDGVRQRPAAGQRRANLGSHCDDAPAAGWHVAHRPYVAPRRRRQHPTMGGPDVVGVADQPRVEKVGDHGVGRHRRPPVGEDDGVGQPVAGHQYRRCHRLADRHVTGLHGQGDHIAVGQIGLALRRGGGDRNSVGDDPLRVGDGRVDPSGDRDDAALVVPEPSNRPGVCVRLGDGLSEGGRIVPARADEPGGEHVGDDDVLSPLGSHVGVGDGEGDPGAGYDVRGRHRFADGDVRREGRDDEGPLDLGHDDAQLAFPAGLDVRALVLFFVVPVREDAAVLHRPPDAPRAQRAGYLVDVVGDVAGVVMEERRVTRYGLVGDDQRAAEHPAAPQVLRCIEAGVGEGNVAVVPIHAGHRHVVATVSHPHVEAWFDLHPLPEADQQDHVLALLHFVTDFLEGRHVERLGIELIGHPFGLKIGVDAPRHICRLRALVQGTGAQPVGVQPEG